MSERAADAENALIPVPAGTIVPPAEEWASAGRYLAAALAPSTRYCYFRAFINFAAWCKERRLIAVSAEPETVAAFLAHEADRGVSPAAIAVRAAAIDAAHEAAEHDPPTKTMVVRRVLSGIRRTRGGERLDRDALLESDVIKVVNATPAWPKKRSAAIPSSRGSSRPPPTTAPISGRWPRSRGARISNSCARMFSKLNSLTITPARGSFDVRDRPSRPELQ